jgi:YggT family protein
MDLLIIPDGHGIVYALILYGIGILLIALFIRMVASLFRIDERFAFIRFLARLTDPFITPYRRFIPSMGIFNFSFLFGFATLFILQTLLTQALPPGW